MIVYELILPAEQGAWWEKRVGLFFTEKAAWDWVREHDPQRLDPYFYTVTAREVLGPMPSLASTAMEPEKPGGEGDSPSLEATVLAMMPEEGE